MERQALDSTSVKSAGYDPEAQVLELEFSGGRVYRYRQVPAGVHAWLLRTPNKGAYVARMVADRYPYEEVGKPGTEEPGDLAAVLRASLDEPDPSS